MHASSCQAVIMQACVLFRDAGCKHSQAQAPAAAGASAPTPRRRQAAAKRRATSSDDQDFQPPPPKQQSSTVHRCDQGRLTWSCSVAGGWQPSGLRPHRTRWCDINDPFSSLLQYKRTGRFEGEHRQQLSKTPMRAAVSLTCHAICVVTSLHDSHRSLLHVCAAHVWNSNTTAPSASGKKGRQLHLGSFQDGERGCAVRAVPL